MDPTSGLFAAEGHIPLVCTPSASQAAPIGGTVETCQRGLQLRHDGAAREPGAAACRSPLAMRSGRSVRELAHAIDRDLLAQDVRLTMGGEPTYVGIDEPEILQWNIEALGPIKRTRGLALIRALRERTAPGLCSTSDRASGIPARLCRAGPSTASRARMACRSGRTAI